MHPANLLVQVLVRADKEIEAGSNSFSLRPKKRGRKRQAEAGAEAASAAKKPRQKWRHGGGAH